MFKYSEFDDQQGQEGLWTYSGPILIKIHHTVVEEFHGVCFLGPVGISGDSNARLVNDMADQHSEAVDNLNLDTVLQVLSLLS